MKIGEIQSYVKEQVDKHGWGGHSNMHRLSYLESEIAEVKEAMLNYTGTEEQKLAIGSELFDVIWNVAEIANRYGIDLCESAKLKMKENENRVFSDVPNKEERDINKKIDLVVSEIRNLKEFTNQQQLETMNTKTHK